MKSFMKSLKRQDGFTLVELMVVVAIIGLLSAVAIPNFKKYQSKAKVSEAKLQLAAAYMAEQSFFSDFNLFSNCLSYMGFDPFSQTASRYYGIGFSGAEANPASGHQGWIAAVNSGLAAACPALGAGAVTTLGAQSYFVAGKGVGASVINTAALHETATTASAQGTQNDTGSMTFIISAAGIISPDGAIPATSSALSINELKIISTTRQGY